MSVTKVIPGPDPQAFDIVQHEMTLIKGDERYRLTIQENYNDDYYIYDRSDMKDKEGKCLRVFKKGTECYDSFIKCDSIDIPVFSPFLYNTVQTVKCPLQSMDNCTMYSKSDSHYIILNKFGYIVRDENDVQYKYHGPADPVEFRTEMCNGNKLPIPDNPCMPTRH